MEYYNMKQALLHLKSRAAFIVLGGVSLLTFACGPDRTILALSASETMLLNEFEQLPEAARLQMSPAGEPGEALTLCGTLVRLEDGKPLAGERIHLYHATQAGEYEPADPADESTARLNGWVTTDSAGRFLVQTILPGDYGSSDDNRHIHTSVEGADPAAYDIHFKQYSATMGTRFINGSDQHFLAELKRSGTGELVTFIQLAVKRHTSLK